MEAVKNNKISWKNQRRQSKQNSNNRHASCAWHMLRHDGMSRSSSKVLIPLMLFWPQTWMITRENKYKIRKKSSWISCAQWRSIPKKQTEDECTNVRPTCSWRPRRNVYTANWHMCHIDTRTCAGVRACLRIWLRACFSVCLFVWVKCRFAERYHTITWLRDRYTRFVLLLVRLLELICACAWVCLTVSAWDDAVFLAKFVRFSLVEQRRKQTLFRFAGHVFIVK